MSAAKTAWFSRLENIDRRIIYLLVALALGTPLLFNISLPPAEMKTATAFYEAVEELQAEPGKFVLVALDWGPGTQAENKVQTMLALEHLMRKRIPFGLISIYSLATPFLREIPKDVAKQLEEEFPNEKWEYGKDWVNFGFRPGGFLMIEGLAKADDFVSKLKTDANGTPLEDIPLLEGAKDIKDISMLMEFTGLVGAFNYWIQFFQVEGYRPPFVHGCTSITIPEAYIYYSAKQIIGLHEGIAGAAWYEALLSQNFASRKPLTWLQLQNSGVALAQLLILGFIVLGNIGVIFGRKDHK